MLTLPQIVEKSAQPYVAVRETVPMDGVKQAVDRSFPKLFGWLEKKGIEPVGAAFFKYNVIDMMNELELEFGVPVAQEVSGDDGIVAGVLPAGRYGQLTWTGPYDVLLDVNAVLIGWAKEKKIRWDMDETAQGERFGCRLEIYENEPDKTPRDELVTTVAIRIAD